MAQDLFDNSVHEIQAMPSDSVKPRGSTKEVFFAFLKLGVTSFGGPIAHLAYFRDEFVTRRKWIDEAAYADLVALCQFLPGPASSQVGFALGLLRGGAPGAMAAWAAFTLPSAVVLIIFAFVASALDGVAWEGFLHGLKIVAVAVVAQAVWGMARTLTPDRQRASIALMAVLIVVFATGSLGQIAAITMGGIAGLWLCRDSFDRIPNQTAFPVSRRIGFASLALFFLLLFLLPAFSDAISSPAVALFDSFYRAGSLVFGGGHVVLPLLEAEVVRPGGVSQDTFLAGYGAAQAVPGPLFTVAAYLGATMSDAPNGIAGAALSLVAIFLPGFLLLIGALPFWNAFRNWPWAQAAMRGTNAAVVGILGAALYDPVWTSAIFGPYDFALALTGFILLTVWQVSPAIIVGLMVAGSIGLTLF